MSAAKGAPVSGELSAPGPGHARPAHRPTTTRARRSKLGLASLTRLDGVRPARERMPALMETISTRWRWPCGATMAPPSCTGRNRLGRHRQPALGDVMPLLSSATGRCFHDLHHVAGWVAPLLKNGPRREMRRHDLPAHHGRSEYPLAGARARRRPRGGHAAPGIVGFCAPCSDADGRLEPGHPPRWAPSPPSTPGGAAPLMHRCARRQPAVPATWARAALMTPAARTKCHGARWFSSRPWCWPLHWLVLSGVPWPGTVPAQPSRQVFSTLAALRPPPQPAAAPSGVTAVPVCRTATCARKRRPPPSPPCQPPLQPWTVPDPHRQRLPSQRPGIRACRHRKQSPWPVHPWRRHRRRRSGAARSLGSSRACRALPPRTPKPARAWTSGSPGAPPAVTGAPPPPCAVRPTRSRLM